MSPGRQRASNSYYQMRRRCTDPRCIVYAYYGGRGIKVCARWLESLANFLEDMGDRPAGTSLDRFPNNDGDYEPGNCRWATRAEQNANRRSCASGQYRASHDMVGARFGRLVVIGRGGRSGTNWKWDCRCDCGGSASVRGPDLRGGRTKSCGCKQRLSRFGGRRPAVHA